MSSASLAPSADACYLALAARDARFDGSFFTGVTSTGIYCRPVCRVRTPKRDNCRFFHLAAQAESAGFRPCLRCRPELAPGAGSWSMEDAGRILAGQAARWLDEPEAWGDAPPTVERLAARLGVSDRHVRRIFEAHMGVSPLQYLQTRRLLTAKQLLTDTPLPVTQVALISGFASVRRFNAAFLAHYRLSPTQLRRTGPSTAAAPLGTAVRLGYRPPCDVAAMLAFFRQRQLDGVEAVELAPDTQGGPSGRLARSWRVASGGQSHTGWVVCTFDAAHHQVLLQVSDSLRGVLPLVMRRVRALLDLDADPHGINQVLGPRFPDTPGLRVPGCVDGFELAVRAVLGQQITVAAARTLTQRVVSTFGEPLSPQLDTPPPGVTRLFPSASVLAQAGGDALGQLGIVKQRQAAIMALAQAVANGTLALHAGVDVAATVAQLKTLPGIGDWTAQYIAMRALRWPDAFPAGDVALHKALGVKGEREAQAVADAWKPWRSYAVLRAWATLPAHSTATITHKSIAKSQGSTKA